MADEDPDPGHADAGPLGSIISGIRGAAENLARAAGSVNPLTVLPDVATHPGALSAAQFTVMRSTLRAQRDGIAALQSQLAAFDEQLQVLDRLLEPMAEWSAAWARVESGIMPQQPQHRTPPEDES